MNEPTFFGDNNPILHIISIIIFFILAGVFWRRAYRKSETIPQKWTNFYYGVFMLCFGFVRLFDFFIFLIRRHEEGIIDLSWFILDIDFWWKLGAVVGIGSFIAIIFVLERYSLKTGYFLTVIESIGLLLIIVFPASEFGVVFDARFISYIFLPLGCVEISLIYLYLVIKSSGTERLKITGAFIGIFLFFLGWLFETRFMHELMNPGTDLHKHLLMISGIIIFSLSQYELVWSHAMKYVNIVNISGISLFQYNFAKNDDTVHSDLVGAGVTSIVNLIQVITQSQKRPKVFDQGDIKVLLGYGNNITAILLTSHDLKILHDKLNELVAEIEHIYSEVFPNWSGDSRVFAPIKKIVERIFQPKLTQQ